jgi:hypothetical protein
MQLTQDFPANEPRGDAFRIGVVVDDNVTDPFVGAFIATLSQRYGREILIIGHKSAATRPGLRETCFRLGHRLEAWLFKSLPSTTPSHLVTAVCLEHSGDATPLAGQELDVLVNLSSSELSGPVLDVAKHGVLTPSLDFTSADRPSVTGFTEVRSREELTQYTINLARSSSEPSQILVNASFGTKVLATANSAEAISQCLFRLCEIIDRMAANQPLPRGAHALDGNGPASGSKPSVPSIIDQSGYALSLAQVYTSKILRRLQKRRCDWKVGYVFGDWRSNLADGHVIRVPEGHFLADPFVISRDNRDYLFAEDWDWSLGRAMIAAFEITPEGAHKIGDALVEPFHLSFPYLLEIDGRLYMLPETSEAREIRLYECVEFPLKWQLAKVLMRDISAADTMIFRRNGLWWMLTNIDRQGTGNHGAEFSIFFSSDPLSDKWTPHAGNPISLDATSGRNGGLLGDWDGSLYRVVQVPGFDTYGRRTRIYEIEELTPVSYREKLVDKIDPDFRPGMRATHHLHSNGRITAFDFIGD